MMNGVPTHTLTSVTSDRLIASYEQLRSQALGGYRGPGLAVFLRQGMKAWMEACSDCGASAPAKVQHQIGCGQMIPASVRSEVVMVLAGMILHGSSEARS